METGEALSVRGLLEDSLMREYLPARFDRAVLQQQLYDQKLLHMDLDELAGLELEELATKALCDCMENESAPAAPPAAQDGEPSPAGGGAAAAPQTPRVQVLMDGMGVEARVILSRPAAGAEPPDLQELRDSLAGHGVVRGVRDDFLARLAERPVYDHRFKVAMGKLPVDGEDGRVVFHFDTEVNLSPQVDEKGLVDYRALDYAKNVKAGELLCEIIPPTAGEDGFSVRGETLPGKRGRPADVRSGSNTTLSPDGTKIFAACDGQVYLRGNKVGVSRVLVVDRVDASTGNILFVGTVQVRGDVDGGFTIRAGGDIIVRGVVEDAVLVAGGNIVLCGGIKGRQNGLLDAGGSIRTLFIESARVRARDSLYADSIVNSTVECGRKVSVSGRRGCLIGGTCRAGRTVSTMQAGNEANIATEICLRDIESFSEQQEEAKLRIARYQGVVGRLRQIVELAESGGREEDAFLIILARVAIVKQRFEREIRRLESDFAQGENNDYTRTISVRETLYPNVTLEIDGELLHTQKTVTGCMAVKRQGRVRLAPIYY